MLTDEVVIKVKAGDGGHGLVSFRHEKYVPLGGPDGGDGGDGGNVILEVNPDTNTLTYFDTRKKFAAANGANGRKARSSGKYGPDLILSVPPGTIVFEKKIGEDRDFIKVDDLIKNKQQLIIAKGGKGGRGNVHFANSVEQAPKYAEDGKPGEAKIIKLEMRMIADVGIIGLPNAGKSTLLSRISNAKPKIANYPFTTLEPNLGVCHIGSFSFIAADIPGLIENASLGKGLGYKFLRHLKRTRVLVHLIDALSQDPIKDYQTIRGEIGKFYKPLLRKVEIVAISKVDTLTDKDQRRLYAKISKFKPIFISSASGRGINDLLYKIKEKLKK